MKIYFSNENLSADTKFMLEKEFIKRRIFANDIYYPLIEKWDKEYTKSHCDEEKISMKKYLQYIRSKSGDMLYVINAKSIGYNNVKLDLNSKCTDFIGYSAFYNTTITIKYARRVIKHDLWL